MSPLTDNKLLVDTLLADRLKPNGYVNRQDYIWIPIGLFLSHLSTNNPEECGRNELALGVNHLALHEGFWYANVANTWIQYETIGMI